MSSNYPPGSMMGSGIYSEEITVRFTCKHCGEDNDKADASTDDWGHIAYTACEHCSQDVEIDLNADAADEDLKAAERYDDYQRENGAHE